MFSYSNNHQEFSLDSILGQGLTFNKNQWLLSLIYVPLTLSSDVFLNHWGTQTILLLEGITKDEITRFERAIWLNAEGAIRERIKELPIPENKIFISYRVSPLHANRLLENIAQDAKVFQNSNRHIRFQGRSDEKQRFLWARNKFVGITNAPLPVNLEDFKQSPNVIKTEQRGFVVQDLERKWVGY